MKQNSVVKIAAFIVLLSVFSACNLFDDSEAPVPEDQYLVSYELAKSYLPVFITSIFDQFTDEYPELENIKNEVQYGIFIYKITYKTTFKGEEKLASGLVCVPIGEGSFPLLSYQNGTNTLHSNAPSVNPDYELYLLLEFVASTGFVVVIPDYLGFGTTQDMFHPYLHKESTVQTVLDMLRAVKEMTSNYLDVTLNNDLYIAGYSQGGWATMQLQKSIELDHSGEFNLKASACGAGPYNLQYINEYIAGLETYPMPYFLGYIFNSYVNLGDITTPRNQIFQEPYATRLSALYDGTKSGDEINAELNTTVSDLFTADYLSGFKTDSKYASVISSLEKNSVSAWKTTTPTMILHGTEDNFVPPQVSSNLFAGFTAAGVNTGVVTLVPLPGLGHSSGIIPSGLASVQWFLNLKE